MALSRAPAPAAAAFEQRVLSAFGKLDDGDTRTAGLGELEDMMRKAEPSNSNNSNGSIGSVGGTLGAFLKLLSDANVERRKPAGRAALMRFVALVATKQARAALIYA
jgi:hypothetical protein